MSSSITTSGSRVKSTSLWVLKILFALFFLGAAGAKLYGIPSMIREFNLVGIGQWFRYFTATTEIAGALLLVVPRTALFGALLLTAICIGAFFAQLLVIHTNVPHTIVMAAILGAIAWVHRGQISLKPVVQS